jgi:hypothetical protein
MCHNLMADHMMIGMRTIIVAQFESPARRALPLHNLTPAHPRILPAMIGEDRQLKRAGRLRPKTLKGGGIGPE